VMAPRSVELFAPDQVPEKLPIELSNWARN
jgi:hypothetical protein